MQPSAGDRTFPHGQGGVDPSGADHSAPGDLQAIPAARVGALGGFGAPPILALLVL